MRTPTGLPSSSTSAAPARSSAAIAAVTGSPVPTAGSGGDMWAVSGWSKAARSANSASSRSRSTTDPTTSAAITGGSSLTTGIWDTPYSRRIAIAEPTVSSGCTCTSPGS